MRYLAATAVVLCSLTLALPVAARTGVETPPADIHSALDDARGSYGGEARQITRQIDRARERGSISRREARQLRREARRLQSQAALYSRNGLSDFERSALDTRAIVLRGIVNAPINLMPLPSR